MGKSVEVDNREDAILKISVHLLLNCNEMHLVYNLHLHLAS